MYSTGDSSGEGLSSRNQVSNFRFTSQNGEVDWASLAQQWIQMRDVGAAVPTEAPPAPIISGNGNSVISVRQDASTMKKSAFEEKGEADMDMDDEDDNLRLGNDQCESPPPPPPSMRLDETKPVTQQQWAFVPPGLEMGGNSNQQSAASAGSTWGSWPPPITLPPPAVIQLAQQSPITAPAVNPTAHIPPLMKINVSNPNTSKVPAQTVEESSGSSTMDAAKRKILPAWIREGLEKMEREKQKELERLQKENQKDGQPQSESIVGSSEKDLKAEYQNDVMVKNKNLNAMASDSSGNEAEEDDDAATKTIKMPKIVAKHNYGGHQPEQSDDSDGDGDGDDAYAADRPTEHKIDKRSYEEKLADLMIVVRKTLTELLLEVTNEEICNVAHETLKSCKAKASSAQVIHKSALSSITGKLGLAAYEDFSSDDGSASENEDSTGNDDPKSEDSEEDIKATIRTKRRNFAKTAEEIEERIAESATREEQKLKFYAQLEQEQEKDNQNERLRNRTEDDPEREYDGHSGRVKHHHHSSLSTSTTAVSQMSAVGSKGYEREFGETTESKLQYSNGKRQKERSIRKERTTRFSDNKDSKLSSVAAAAATATYLSQMQASTSTSSSISNQKSATLFPIATTSSSTNDSNPVYSVTTTFSGSAMNKSLLNAAEAAFEKVTKSKSSTTTSEKQRREERRHHRERSRHKRHSSNDETSSSGTSDSTSESDSSSDSKYSRTSSKHSSKKSDRRHRSSSSSRHHHRRHHHHHYSSRHSSKRSHSRTRSRSRSRTSYTSSSRRRRH